MTSRKFQSFMKENRIPIGKKKENIEQLLKKNEEPKLDVDQRTSKTKIPKTSKKLSTTSEKAIKTNGCKPLKLININVEPTETSIIKPITKPRIKLSTIKEMKEFEEKSNMKMMKKKKKIVNYNSSPILVSTENNLKEEINTDNFNNTIDNINPVVPEVVLSPFVCTTRGHKWKPSPRIPPKLSELFEKYEADNVPDNYRKKLDTKTTELQNKVRYWAELSSENGSDIPQSVKDEIDVACGQTKLLTTDKFMQMSSLINEYDNNSGPMPITTDDLDGFWDMLMLQVEKLEGQFNQLAILKENNWAPLEPIAKKVINKLPTAKKHLVVVKSKFADFIKTQKLKEKKATPKSESSNEKNDQSNSRFNEIKTSNNTCMTSSTPTSSNQKSVNFTPVLLKTMELSYVARRSGMTPIVLETPHVSPLPKTALKKPENEKGIKRKNIHFESPKKVSSGFVTPENSCNVLEDINHKNIQNRVVTPYTTKTSKAKKQTARFENNLSDSSSTNPTGNKINLKGTITVQPEKKKTVIKTSADTQVGKTSIRRSSRLATKPSKNYKC